MITSSGNAKLQIFDCWKCTNHLDLDESVTICTVKHIDCSIRNPLNPCSHYQDVRE